MKNKTFKILIFAVSMAIAIGTVNTNIYAKEINNKQELRTEISKNLNKHKTKFSFTTTKMKIGIKKMQALLIAELKYNPNNNYEIGLLKHYRISYYTTTYGSYFKTKYNIEFKYRETKKQQKHVNKKVKSIIKKLKLNKKSDYQKAKLITKWISNNVKYDLAYKNYTAYKALTQKKAVCQGFALLSSKLYNAAGLKSYIITGKSISGTNHVWNAVKIKDKFYYADNCYYENVKGSGKEDKYFLFGTNAAKKDRYQDLKIKGVKISKNNYKKK